MEKAPFYLWDREGIWYYRLPSETTFHSTGIKSDKNINKRRVEQWVLKNKVGKPPAHDTTFLEYAEPFFVWDRCPRIRRRLAENKSIGKKHARLSRRLLEKHVFPDSFSKLSIGKIRRGEILDLRDRILTKAGIATVNRTISAVKAVFSEALYREDIDRDPGARIGAINYTTKERGIFSISELQTLFSEIPGIWQDLRAFAVFYTTALTGMRSGEVLALMWEAIDFSSSEISIHQAWKEEHELGLPKWEKKRAIPVSTGIIHILSNLKDYSVRLQPNDLVFCYDDGSRLGTTWWRKNFNGTMAKAGIDYKERNVTPHSLRHSLNTHLLGRGCDPFKIREYLGWSNNVQSMVLTPVQRGYTHLGTKHLKDVVDFIDGIFGS